VVGHPRRLIDGATRKHRVISQAQRHSLGRGSARYDLEGGRMDGEEYLV
jgi:hypothetical protein